MLYHGAFSNAIPVLYPDFRVTCNTIYRNTAGGVNLLHHIRSSIDSATAEINYRAMIMLVFTDCGSGVLGCSNSRANQIQKY